ncbi:zinc ribbon domain-containing protein [Corynebacterium pelargi]|uniref:Chromosome partition protein Smc n=1 Tax=Corynebacterium pelargi TaxID=1471400 RepID=A0A410W7L0_9CORY|nr:C4-type zinc ribbon domain-containing protein [Corynebacterium pelargi]QAU51943.1 Chromosome partition protein Smc [Corynebacterium pelargi]GGG71284.1 Zn-ribbon protein [Corynebacterium pelargi]
MQLALPLQETLLELSTLERNGDVEVVQVKSEEQQELERLSAKQMRIRDAAASAQLAVDDMELEIRRIQDDERKLRRRLDDDRRQLGAATDEELRKDLQHDLHSAQVRIQNLTSEMQEAHNEVHALRANRDLYQQQLREIEAEVAAAQRAVDALPVDTSEEDVRGRVEKLRAALPEEVLAAYEERRSENGIGAAKFNGRSCGGCHIMLPVAEASRIRQAPETEVPECGECGSYLIRGQAA